MADRKLATIQKIIALNPIEGADKIEVATIKGWQVVVPKNTFKINDLCVFFEIDSLIPRTSWSEFLFKHEEDTVFRLKTIKLKKQISQGLALPTSIINNYIAKEDADVTELLGIKKYLSDSEQEEVAISQKKEKKFSLGLWRIKSFLFGEKTIKKWPYWVQKTDEERIQNMPQVLNQFKDSIVDITEKIDYQSVTFTAKQLPKYSGLLGKIFKQTETVFLVCSRNCIITGKDNLYWKIAKKYKIEELLTRFPYLTIQGEQGDPSVQKNKYGIKEPTFWVFNIINHEAGYQYSYDEMVSFCSVHELPLVPLIERNKLSDICHDVKEIVEYSKGTSIINPAIPREGIVVRVYKEGQKLLSFKVINPDFLLKFNE